MRLIDFIKSSIIYTIYVTIIIEATISPSSKGKKAKTVKEIKVNSGPIDKNVFQRNLIEDEPFAKDILVENAAYCKDTKKRLFEGQVLGYVTPVSRK